MAQESGLNRILRGWLGYHKSVQELKSFLTMGTLQKSILNGMEGGMLEGSTTDNTAFLQTLTESMERNAFATPKSFTHGVRITLRGKRQSNVFRQYWTNSFSRNA